MMKAKTAVIHVVLSMLMLPSGNALALGNATFNQSMNQLGNLFDSRGTMKVPTFKPELHVPEIKADVSSMKTPVPSRTIPRISQVRVIVHIQVPLIGNSRQLLVRRLSRLNRKYGFVWDWKEPVIVGQPYYNDALPIVRYPNLERMPTILPVEPDRTVIRPPMPPILGTLTYKVTGSVSVLNMNRMAKDPVVVALWRKNPFTRTQESLKRFLQQHSSKIMSVWGVNGVGIGVDCPFKGDHKHIVAHRPAIVVYLDQR